MNEISSLYSQINYHDAPVRVSPLNYADFFKWWANKDGGIPAYVIVNMSTQDTEIVRLDNPIYYSDSDPFFNNVDRHVQLSYPFYMFDEKSFEIDEEGNPYWIYPVQDRTIVFLVEPPSSVLFYAMQVLAKPKIWLWTRFLNGLTVLILQSCLFSNTTGADLSLTVGSILGWVRMA